MKRRSVDLSRHLESTRLAVKGRTSLRHHGEPSLAGPGSPYSAGRQRSPYFVSTSFAAGLTGRRSSERSGTAGIDRTEDVATRLEVGGDSLLAQWLGASRGWRCFT